MTRLLCLLAAACLGAVDLPLLDPATQPVQILAQELHPGRGQPGIRSWGVTTAVVDGWLEVRSGHALPWPSVAIDHPADLTGHGAVAIDVNNPSDQPVELRMRLDIRGGANAYDMVQLAPGASGTLSIALDTPEIPGFTPLHLRLAPPGFGGRMDPSRFAGVVVFVDHPDRDQVWRIRNLRALPRSQPAYAFAKPFIDRYGQFMPATWPGKIAADADFAAARSAEEADRAAHPAPAGWNAWGGWAAGPQLEASGRFRPAKHDGRWWLVDPDGRLFWSHGITCVGLLEDSPISRREDWFADLPAVLEAFPSCRDTFAWLNVGGRDYAGQKPATFAFNQANLMRKFGKDWRAASHGDAHQRLRSWGLNTLGCWSDAGLAQLRRTPYTTFLCPNSPRIEGAPIRDPWHPRFAESLRDALRANAATLGDPWCLGHFVENELPWGGDTALAAWTLKAPATQPAKLACLAWLKTRHADLAALNAAWGTAHASWEALLAAREVPVGAGARDDLLGFTRLAAARYFDQCRDAIHAADAQALFLGTRLNVWNEAVLAAAGAACDVVSFNIYSTGIAGFAPSPAIADRPLLISEFHTGAMDRGLPRGGNAVMVQGQAERAERYASYVDGAVRHSGIVGTHWFQYRDEPATGRKCDDENFQIGFVDVADQPYAELVAAARGIAAQLYQTRAAR
jgi:hypothetical protein